MHDWPAIAASLGDAGLRCDPARTPRALSGGDVSAAWRVESAAGPVFVKSAPLSSRDMLEAEYEGLGELSAAAAVRVPRPLALVHSEETAVLAIEWLDLAPPDADVNRLFGRQLAELHRHRGDRHGWHRDNTIGATPQSNKPDDDWVRFFREQRLGPQFELAAANGYASEFGAGRRVLEQELGRLFDGYEPVASLLHGDLWGGNWAAVDGQPVIFDPALHYGDRESDIAMTRLFGGFGAGFYRAYEDSWPLAGGADARLHLYQLYHVLNHLNLFGAGYLGQARRLLARLRRALA